MAIRDPSWTGHFEKKKIIIINVAMTSNLNI
jgi:hypothetical protein